MKTLVKLSVVVGLLMAFLSPCAFAASAAETPYKIQVQPGDTLWDLSTTYHNDPLKWAEVLGANPFLKDKGRVINHPDGRVIVLIMPGEELAGLNRIGVKAEMIPFSSLWPAAVALSSTTSAESVKGGGVSFYQTPIFGIPLWAVVLWAITLALVIIYTMRKDGLISSRSAATAGPPIIQGGIAPSQPAAIEDRFERIAERRYGERNPSADLSADRPQRISDIMRGLLSGNGLVRYNDPARSAEPRRLNREPAYSARFRFPGGAEETLYFLEACANDVVFRGMRYDGFRWESERVVVSTPAPAPTESPAASGVPVARTPLRAVASPMPPVPPVMTTVAVGDIRVTIPEGSFAHIGRDGKITIAVAAACDVVIAPAQEASAGAKTAAS